LPFWNRKTDTRLVVGLGNPGEKYAGNRHNIGFMCLDYFAHSHDIVFERSRSQAKIGLGRVLNREIVLAKPQTYMNNSGEAVGKLIRQHKVKIENLIVVHDDLDLPVGRIRIRLGGSSGGHKGINSIVRHISNQDFIHVRVGIGRPNSNGQDKGEDEIVNYVLGDFTPEEKAVMDKVIPGVDEIVNCLFAEGLTATMNRFNGTDLKQK
jgi:PTH1 family peptidyl-tRNA hydrolase